jgi:hypothetical protein
VNPSDRLTVTGHVPTRFLFPLAVLARTPNAELDPPGARSSQRPRELEYRQLDPTSNAVHPTGAPGHPLTVHPAGAGPTCTAPIDAFAPVLRTVNDHTDPTESATYCGPPATDADPENPAACAGAPANPNPATTAAVPNTNKPSRRARIIWLLP